MTAGASAVLAGCGSHGQKPAKTPNPAATALQRLGAAGSMRATFKAWHDLLAFSGTAELARDGALHITCTETNPQERGTRSGWPADIEAIIAGGRVYARDSRLKLPAGRTWTVADWASRQVVPAVMFALLDPTLALGDPTLRDALRPGPIMKVGTGGQVSPAAGQRTLNGSLTFPADQPGERLRDWYRGAGKTSYLAFGLVVGADGAPVRFTAECYPPAAGIYLFDATIEALGQPVSVPTPPADQTIPVTEAKPG